jgi:hypothetical protein
MLTVLVIVLLVLLLGGGWYGYRGAAWGTAGPGYPDVVGLLLLVLVIVLVVWLVRGVL